MTTSPNALGNLSTVLLCEPPTRVAPRTRFPLGVYTAPSHTCGAMPFVVKSGDELQLPPVPEDSSLLAPPTGSKEHAAGVKIFAQQDYCYRLTTMMRFDDELLVTILGKRGNLEGVSLLHRSGPLCKPLGSSRARASPATRWLEVASARATEVLQSTKQAPA